MRKKRSRNIQRKSLHSGIFIIFCFLSFFFLGRTTVFAAVKEGEPGETLNGKYAVIVNTSTTEQESSGTLVFDASPNAASNDTFEAFETVETSLQEHSLSQASQNRASAIQSETASYSIGTEKTIVSASGGSQTYVCIGEGEHCYVWMSKQLMPSYDAAKKTETIAKDMASTYDGVPYQTLSEMASGTIPCQDHTGKLSILLETLSGASGMYKSDFDITAIHIHAPDAGSYQLGTMESRNGLLVHEGQHALFHLLTNFDARQPYTWLNEGLAVASMDYIWGGTDNSGWMDGIAGNADIRNGSSLIYGSYRDQSARDYGMTYLFVRYLIAQKAGGYRPMELFPLFYQQSANCAPSDYLEKVFGDDRSFSEILTDFYAAILAQEPSGRYGFAGDAIVFEKVRNYPFYLGESGASHQIPPTGAIAIRLKNGAFEVPSDGGENIRYLIIDEERKICLPASGDGSRENPYQITTFAELNCIGNRPDACYRLEAEIFAEDDLNLTVTNFYGTLDGNGHTIHGLKRPLVGRNSGTIRNLTIEAAWDGEYTSAQGIFAQVNEGLIADCTAKGTVTMRMLKGQSSFDETAFGGIAGINQLAGIIRGSGFAASVHLRLPAVTSWVGGIAGIQLGAVEKCYSRGTVAATQLNGNTHNAYMQNSADSYDVYAGGIAGEIRKQGAFGGSLSDCVHSGSVSISGGNQAIGQLCGIANQNVINSTLGLSGHLSGCYAKQGGGAIIGYPAEAFPTEEILLSEEAFKNPASYHGWDFVGEWKMDESGPLRISADDIETLTVSDAPASCYVGEIPYQWGFLQVNDAGRVKITEDMVLNFDSSTPKISSVTVSYLGKTASFSIEVKAPNEVLNLTAATKKNKLYHAGELFDPSTVYLLATIDGNPYRIIYSGFDYDKKSPLQSSDTSVTLTYYGASVLYPITIQEKKAASITVSSKLNRTDYEEGQKLDLSGVRAKLTYDNGEETMLLSAEQFKEYGIHAAKVTGDSVTAIETNAILSASDHNAEIFLYAGDTLPGTYGAVTAAVGTIHVLEKLSVPEMTLHLVSGREVLWLTTEPILGGSGNYATQVIQENLPAGISRVKMPEGDFGYFEYRGTTTSPAGSIYRSTYRIEDTVTGVSFAAEVKIQVHAANEAAFFQFDLRKRDNPALKEDIIGIIGENTVVLSVPEGTDVSELIPYIDFGYSMGVTLPPQFWNGSSHDFTTPVIYPLTAADGITEKQYTVFVEFVSESEPNPKPKPTVTDPPDIQESVSPAIGETVRFQNAYYIVTANDAHEKTVELKALAKKKIASFQIPAVIKIDGDTYRVTSIGKNAFQKNRYLKKVTIGKEISSIGANAFRNCKNLRTLTIKSKKLRTIGKNAIQGIKRTAAIFVPKQNKKAYQKLFRKKTGYSNSIQIK